jgi:hypothetical protein
MSESLQEICGQVVVGVGLDVVKVRWRVAQARWKSWEIEET